MSFNFEFIAATPEAATKIVEQETAPDSVKAFLMQAITAIKVGPVKVKAMGHLFNGDYATSTANIEVYGVVLREPK